MITSQKIDDEYSFPLLNDMLTKPMDKPYSEIRLHLVGLFSANDIITNAQRGMRVKKDDFEIIVRQITMSTFGIEL